jgi:type I restriction enzyme S subunit
LDIEVNLPPLQEQKRIVDLISSVDSYIDALQQQADSARKSRSAVLNDSLNRLMSISSIPLREFAILQRGHDLPSQERNEGSFPIVASNGIVGSHNIAKANGPGVVTGRSGTIGKVHYIEQDYWPLNTSLYVTDFKGNVPKYVALVLETIDLKSFAGGSTVPSLDRKVLNEIPVPVATVEEQHHFCGLISAFENAIGYFENLLREARNIRSGLLSDLLSGDHEIPASYDKIMSSA